MNKRVRILGAGLILSAVFWGCQSKTESSGDAFLKAGDPANAIAQYEAALQQGGVSNGFYANYARAYLQLMQIRSSDDPGSVILDALKDTVVDVLKLHPNAEVGAEAANIFFEVGENRLKLETPSAEEGAFQFFTAANAMAGKSPEIGSKYAAAQQKYVADKLAEVQSKLDEASSDGTASILADYDLNKMALAVGGETPEMRALWSKVRAKNLNVYLLYTVPGLIEQVDSRINKYGMLMAIVKYTPSAGMVKIEAKVWNQTSGPVEIDGSDFRLVDRQGNAYEPVAKLGSFAKKAMVELSKESAAGGLNFKLPVGAEPDYLELKVADGRESRKYLP